MLDLGSSLGVWNLTGRPTHNLAKQKGIIMSKVSPMSDEFHDWLDSCPVQWFRGEVTKDHVAYYFETPEEDEDDSN